MMFLFHKLLLAKKVSWDMHFVDPVRTKDNKWFICKLLYLSNILRGGEKLMPEPEALKRSFNQVSVP